ncbi:MAG: FHA domain-containing protein [Elusimicrobia bacterium]|nr:FHA domain-containing protein [Elusimicrobiota bacterium]
MTKLVLKYNGAVVKELTVEKDAVAIGRHPDSDLVIDNPAVSGRHCRVVKENGAFFIEDLDSTNGTFLRGLEITKAPLRHQDEFAVAKHTVLFLDADAPAAPPVPAPVSTDATVIMTAPPAVPAPAPQAAGARRLREDFDGGRPGGKTDSFDRVHHLHREVLPGSNQTQGDVSARSGGLRFQKTRRFLFDRPERQNGEAERQPTDGPGPGAPARGGSD